MGYAAAALFIAGGILVAISTTLPSVGHDLVVGPLYAISVIAVLAGIGFGAFPTRIPDVLYYAANAGGSILVAGVIYFSDASVAASYGVLFVFVAAYAFMFFRSDIAIAETVFAGIAFATSLGLHPGDPAMAPIVVIFGGCVMAGGLIGTLGQHARSVAARELEAADRLRELHSMRNIFLQALSHELRTPLAVMLGAAETIEARHDQLAPQQVGELASRQVQHGTRLLRMITDLLDVDRLAAGRLTPRPQRVRVDELVRSCAERVDPPDHRIEFNQLSPLEADVDPAYVERVVEQLIANVVTHTPPGTEARVSVRLGDRRTVRISVEDDGPGIEPDRRDAVFEPFHRPDDYRPGVGVGLALVRHLVETHAGRVWVADTSSGGTAVHVELPLRSHDEESA